MAKRRFIQLKDSPETLKGAIMEERCDDGTQGFRCINLKDHCAIPEYAESKQTDWDWSRKVITDQPEWFQEVELMYLTKDEIKQVKKLLKR